MGHLGPENVRREFKGMVERCADCGFDLAGGQVEVIPTAHYMMGGVAFDADCTTAMPRLYAAGEDTGGVHGANRLGGNGVANSTVFGGLAGDSDGGEAARATAALADPDAAAIEAAHDARLRAARPAGAAISKAIRRRLYRDDVGRCRHPAHRATGSRAAPPALDNLAAAIVADAASPDADRRYNLTWMDRLNLENLILVSRAICAAALARTDSRGAHFREDFPAASDLATSRYTVARLVGDAPAVETEPVAFTRVRPGEVADREGGVASRVLRRPGRRRKRPVAAGQPCLPTWNRVVRVPCGAWIDARRSDSRRNRRSSRPAGARPMAARPSSRPVGFGVNVLRQPAAIYVRQDRAGAASC